ncbi:hypothetical protein HMPREF1008_01749 [Olsenella sp. oral taxon 809 str. F0356]|nr:nucleoid-associated protein [Olsenella sp. oral taxon 809]EHF01269.1 hypothetical protein HMPREF1008_01749 [Olsenella sp. oral taxon 809 str. F0356]
MLRVTHAILHAFEFETGSSYLSERELDLSQRPVRSYVQRRLRSVSSSPDNRHGSFSEQSAFAQTLDEYRRGQVGFVEISDQLGRYLWEELRRCEELEECDLLVADFSETQDMGSKAAEKTQVAQAFEDAATSLDEDEAPDLSRRCFAAVLLPRKQAFVHDLGNDASGMAANEILRQDSTLPNPTAKVDSYLLVDLQDLSIDFRDKPRTQGSQERLIIPDGLLQCSAEASSREAMEAVERIVEDVAEECGISPVEAVAQAKAYVASSAEREEAFSPEEVGREVFEGRPDVQERYEQAAREERLPEEVSVRCGVANRMAKSHKIRTDTGIEISFPSEYASNDDYIEFSRDAEGRVSILIKNVGSIQNK